MTIFSTALYMGTHLNNNFENNSARFSSSEEVCRHKSGHPSTETAKTFQKISCRENR